MADMLVRLYDLPAGDLPQRALEQLGIELRRPNAWDKPALLEWVREQFGDGWISECEAAFTRRPATCFITVADGALLGFACYDCTRRNFFGPTGVAEAARGKGIGTALLLAALHAMRDDGYAYAIIGGLGPSGFYAKAVGAIPIAGSTPGIYEARLRRGARDSDSSD